MQDLAIDPYVVKTLDLDGPIQKRDISAPESENEVTAVSVIDNVSHNDNKEQDKNPQTRKRNKSTTSSKDATKRNKSRKSASKENVVTKPARPSNQTFTGLTRKSLERRRSTS